MDLAASSQGMGEAELMMELCRQEQLRAEGTIET